MFKIKTNQPNVKVSWQVAGVRHDPTANLMRIQVETDKPISEKGFYLIPEAYGKGKEMNAAYRNSSRYNAGKPSNAPQGGPINDPNSPVNKH
jgi:hypothetical protein